MKRLHVLGLLAAAMLVQAPRLAMAQATFTVPSNLAVAPGYSGSFYVSVTTDTSYNVYAFTVDVVLTPVGGATGLTLTGASDSSLSSYLLNGNSDTLAQGPGLNTTTDQGGASSVINTPYYVTVPAGTYTLIQVNYSAAPTATGSYVVSFDNTSALNELTVDNGGVTELAPDITGTLSAVIGTPVTQSTSYTLAASASALKLHTSSGASYSTITTTITNTGTTGIGSDALAYTSLGSSVAPTGGTSLSSPAGAGAVAPNSAGTANATTTQTFSSTVAGSYTFGPSGGTVTNQNLGGNASLMSTTNSAVNVYTGQSTWTGSSSGNWSDYSKWDSTGGAPGVYGPVFNTDTATFAGAAGATSVNLDTSPYIQTLTFNSTTGSYTLSGSGTLNLNGPGPGAAVSVTGSHSISTAVNMVNSTTITTNTPASTLTISGPISGSGSSLTAAGSGLVVLSGTNTYTGGTAVTGGTLQTRQVANSLSIANGAKLVLANSGGTNPNASVVSAGALSIGPTGVLDLTDNGLIVTGATAGTQTTIASLISGGEITSSVVAAHSGMTLAVDFASDIHLTFTGGNATWGGQTIASGDAASDLLVFPTLEGDVNMDGMVNFTDVTALAPNLGKTSGQTWGNGDFNGDDAVNFTDVTALAPNLGKSVLGLSAPNFEIGAPAVAATPEPASLALLAFGGMLILPRRRARQH